MPSTSAFDKDSEMFLSSGNKVNKSKTNSSDFTISIKSE